MQHPQNLTPFAALEVHTLSKEANVFTRTGAWLSKNLGRLGKGVSGSGQGAKAKAQSGAASAFNKSPKAKNLPVNQRINQRSVVATQAGNGVGNARISAGRSLTRGADWAAKNPGLLGGLVLGAPVAGGALYGSNRLGHASGKEKGMAEGVEKGFDAGMDYGIQGAQAYTPQDPGFLGRLLQLFTGYKSQMDPSALREHLGQNKSELIAQILSGQPTTEES